MSNATASQSMTTAKLRSLAYDAQEAGNYFEAAGLYSAALAAYPEDQIGALAEADKDALRRHASRNLSMSFA